MAFSLFRGIRRVSLIKIAQCLDPDPNLKYQKAKKREKSPKKGSDHHSKREKDSKKSERKKLKKDQKDQISLRKSEKTGQAEIPRNQDGLFNVEKEHSGVIDRLLETGDRPESPVPDYEPDYDEPGEYIFGIS